MNQEERLTAAKGCERVECRVAEISEMIESGTILKTSRLSTAQGAISDGKG